MKKIIINTDGGARGNPGPAAAGAVLVDEQGRVLQEISDYLGHTTNNVAEYEALERALRAVLALIGTAHAPNTSIEVRMDSELIIQQMKGVYRVKNPRLREYFLRIEGLRAQLPHLTFIHVRRELNKHADALVNKAIDRVLDQQS